jgi:ABC-type branched-subunit amino acid transport system ATPase component
MLRAQGISVQYGGVLALDDVSIEIATGAVVGLIGPNGAGKTTLIDAITGFVDHDGRVELVGHDLTTLPPHARSRLGVGRTWQSGALFDDLTVAENLEVAASRSSPWATVRDTFRRRPAPGDRAAAEAAARLGLEAIAGVPAGRLSAGDRTRTGIARALASVLASRTTGVLLLDEPAAGLDPAERNQLALVIPEIARSGLAVLVVDHDTGLVLDACDRVIVLDFGVVVADGPPDAVRADPRVVAAYLGTA